ncbi:unnamed protein product, partial [Adineta steineri]
KFQDIKQCQQYIEQTSQKDRLVFIVSGRLGLETIPYIHQLRQVISIYVYCMDKKNNEQWALKFAKVKSVVVNLDELVSQITTDHKSQKKVEEPLSINIFTTNVDAGKSTTGVNGQFVFSQILVDCLLQLKSTDIDKNELINLCENEYEGNYTELNNLREFQQNYSPDKVLRCKHSYFPGESEVLFMIGSIFRLNNINRNDDQIWIIKMTLCNDDEHDLKQVLMYMKQQINSEQTNLRTFAKLLWEMGKFDLAEKYFNRLLQELSLNDTLHISLYEDLGKLASQRGDYDMSMKWRQKLLTFKEENPSASNVSVNKTNNSIILSLKKSLKIQEGETG